MREKPAHISFALSVLTTAAAGLVVSAGTWLVSQSWSATAFVALAWICFALAIATMLRKTIQGVRRRFVDFVPPLSGEEAQDRIRSAEQEIWSFQISGSEFTASSIETYEAWLSGDRNRRLLIAFVNPDNTELLKNIVKHSGVAKIINDDEKYAYEHLRRKVETGLRRYVELRETFGEQVDVRVYDFSPPYSVHAIDPDGTGNPSGSLFVELYLPDLPSHERPCMHLAHDHAWYTLYRTRSLAWFEAADAVDPASGSTPRHQDPTPA